MTQKVSVLLLCLLSVYGSLTLAATGRGAPVLSKHGYAILLRVSDYYIWLGPHADGFAQEAELIVKVHDAQGQPVDDLAVVFHLEPLWEGVAAITPQHTTTRNGIARAIFKANTTGYARIKVSVDNVILRTGIAVSNRMGPGSSSGGPYR